MNTSILKTNKFEKWVKKLGAEHRALIEHSLSKLCSTVKPSDVSKLATTSIYELKIHSGPGFRVYMERCTDHWLLIGGSLKRDQKRWLKNA